MEGDLRRQNMGPQKMTAHPQSFRIIGFCDAGRKMHGTAQITYFKPEHRAVESHLPTQSRLKLYATTLGYLPNKRPQPTGFRWSIVDKCEPVYDVIGEGLDYVDCRLCFAREPIIDNRR